MSTRKEAPAGVGTPYAGAEKPKPGRGNGSTSIVASDNWTDKTAARIFEVLGQIYAEENNLEVVVTVKKKAVGDG